MATLPAAWILLEMAQGRAAACKRREWHHFITGERNDKSPAANSAPPTDTQGNCDGSHELFTAVIAPI